MGLSGLPLADLVAWVEASCARQGLMVAISNPSTIVSVAGLLTGRARGGGGRAERAPTRPGLAGSDQPVNVDPVVIESVGLSSGGLDDDVVDDLADDGDLPGEV